MGNGDPGFSDSVDDMCRRGPCGSTTSRINAHRVTCGVPLLSLQPELLGPISNLAARNKTFVVCISPIGLLGDRSAMKDLKSGACVNLYHAKRLSPIIYDLTSHDIAQPDSISIGTASGLFTVTPPRYITFWQRVR